jgi:putative hydrolase of the HAD superfamily
MITLYNPVFLDYKSKESVDLMVFIKEKNIKMVYWDLGGTLVDIPEKIKQKNVDEISTACNCQLDLTMYDHLFRKEWARRETPDAQQKIKSVKTDKDELEYWKDFFRSAFSKYNIRKHSKLLEKLAKTYANARSFETYPFAKNILTELEKMGIRTGVISNAFRSARRILKQEGLINKFNSAYIFLSCEYNSIKPEENIYKKAIERAGVEAKEIVFIDDRESFLGQAVNLGMNALVIRHKEHLAIPSQESYENPATLLISIAHFVLAKPFEYIRTLFIPLTEQLLNPSTEGN